MLNQENPHHGGTDHGGQTRYSRQILMPEIGEKGQKALAQKKVLVVGAGGLGTPCAAYLSGMGVGHITIMDHDSISLSNLPRQFMYDPSDMGKMKAAILAQKLHKANPDIIIEPLTIAANPDSIQKAAAGCNVVVSCVDNPQTRYAINQACVQAQIPMVEGGVSGFQGMATVIWPGKGPCYECLFPARKIRPETCLQPTGIAAPVPGVIGSIQAIEVLKILLGQGQPLTGQLLIADFLSGNLSVIRADRKPDCRICSHLPIHDPSA